MRILRLLAASFLLGNLSSCKAPEDPEVGPTASEVKEEAHSFLEYVIIEARIGCIEGIFSDSPEARTKANEIVFSHHEVDLKWLQGRRLLSKSDELKADKTAPLLEEARASVCPGGKPDAELTAMIAGVARDPATPAEEAPTGEQASAKPEDAGPKPATNP